MKKTWYEIYIKEIEEKKSISNYINDKIKTKKNLIELIKKYAPNKKINKLINYFFYAKAIIIIKCKK